VISSPRTTLSMGSHGALPKAFTRIHPKYRTPAFGTVFFGVAAAVLLAMLAAVSANFLGDAILSVGLLIAFYYGVTGLACVWHFRRQLTNSVRDLFLKGILPAVGGLIMLAAFARSAHDMLAPDYGATSFHGVGGVFLLGVGAIVIGAVAMLVVRTRFPAFFRAGRDAVTHLTVTEE
jgi:amino acid transporter